MRCVGIGDSDLGRRAARDAFPRGTWEREKPGKEGSRECAKTRRRAKNAIYAFALLVLDEVEALALAVTGNLGGKVGVAPRIFLKKLVGEVLDRVDQFDDFDPRRHYALTISDNEPPVSNA